MFSVRAYTTVLRFRASGILWWPGAQNAGFDAPSPSTHSRLWHIWRCFDFMPLVARGTEYHRIHVLTRPRKSYMLFHGLFEVSSIPAVLQKLLADQPAGQPGSRQVAWMQPAVRPKTGSRERAPFRRAVGGHAQVARTGLAAWST